MTLKFDFVNYQAVAFRFFTSIFHFLLRAVVLYWAAVVLLTCAVGLLIEQGERANTILSSGSFLIFLSWLQ